MNTKKEVLEKLKRAKRYLEDENTIGATSIVNDCVDILELSIKREDERVNEYMDNLIKELK